MTGGDRGLANGRPRGSGASIPAVADALPPFRGPAYLVALGGVLVIHRLPFVGPLGPVLGMLCVLVGVGMVLQRTSDPLARGRLTQALVVAAVVAALVLVFAVASLVGTGADPAGVVPVWVAVVTVAQVALGALGTGLLTVAMTRESSARGWSSAADAWWAATVAVVLLHGPILAATVIVHVVGRPGGVHGLLALGLFTNAVTPSLLVARAGGRAS
jgi:hypothetical protein